MDHQEGHLQSFFDFLGITDLEFIRAEGTAMGDEQRQRALDGRARSRIGTEDSVKY